MTQKSYNDYSHFHCWDQIKEKGSSACGQTVHTRCCLCERTAPPSPKGWEEQLEYALPDRLTEEEKQVIRNNVASLLLQSRNAYIQEVVEEIEGMREELPKRIDLEIDAIGASNAIRGQGFNQALDEVIKILKRKQ